MHVRINESICSGCGICVDTCPDIFQIGEDGLAKVVVEAVPCDLEEACYDAVAQCPTEAIVITIARGV